MDFRAAILFRDRLQSRIQIVARDSQARYLWIRLPLSQEHIIFIALCYFAPSSSRFAIIDREEDSPYTCLSEEITEYSALGQVLLMGDFNARTSSDECEIFDAEDPQILHPIEDESIARASADSTHTRYGTDLLRLGSRHNLVIYNGMAQWPTSGGLTCIPHLVTDGRGSTVDYVMGSREAIHLLTSFTIPPIPIGANHTYLALSLKGDTPTPTPAARIPHTTIHFTHELAHVYAAQVEKDLLLFHPNTPLSLLISQIASILHTSAISSFPHTIHSGHTPPPGTMPQHR
ncbi:hypothetical protein KP509_17G027200 [Ceratopteris richardii]|uniref:Endonuclease/exonuclease/phosphatase domain-containing protein n=1 Tax=Ceratopteris richardii TaxID=49495 RepID=A0A8T2STP7_CERRI|nr:hypothetical protein KP509_17G027200 [Ceratopteris richardii]